MGSTSFLGFSFPNLLLVFSEPVIFRNLCYIFLASVGTFSGSFLFYFYFSVPFLGWLVTTEIRFFSLKSKKEKVVLDRGQNGF